LGQVRDQSTTELYFVMGITSVNQGMIGYHNVG